MNNFNINSNQQQISNFKNFLKEKKFLDQSQGKIIPKILYLLPTFFFALIKKI